jgi:prophage maintenance system killer protein
MGAQDPVTLSAEEVLKIHEILAADFARGADPIAPSGIRSLDLLQSAVSRQLTGSGGVLKYPGPVDNAATLVFGICLDHPFHNGNKRTALVAMLVHLDKNRLCLFGTNQNDLYKLLLGVASHSLGFRPDPRRPDKEPPRREADAEVADISDWIGKRVERLQRGERQITFRNLRVALERFGYSLGSPHNNTLDVLKRDETAAGFLRKASVRMRRIGSIGYRDEGTVVSLKDIKKVRVMCQLTEEDGVDSAAFYNDDAVIDTFVNHYRTVLRRLAKT